MERDAWTGILDALTRLKEARDEELAAKRAEEGNLASTSG